MGISIVLSTDGSVYYEMCNNSLEYYQGKVNGYIEIVPLIINNMNIAMVINEEGKLKNMPKNNTASVLYSDVCPDKTEYIVGNAVLVKYGADDIIPFKFEEAKQMMYNINIRLLCELCSE